jgi:hypothetical protein
MVFHGQDAWRNQEQFKHLWRKNPLPGFKYAVVIYSTYVLLEKTAEYAGWKESSHAVAHGHADDDAAHHLLMKK